MAIQEMYPDVVRPETEPAGPEEPAHYLTISEYAICQRMYLRAFYANVEELSDDEAFDLYEMHTNSDAHGVAEFLMRTNTVERALEQE